MSERRKEELREPKIVWNFELQKPCDKILITFNLADQAFKFLVSDMIKVLLFERLIWKFSVETD